MVVDKCQVDTAIVELAAKPSLLFFLDEPTSGLDGQVSTPLPRQFILTMISRAPGTSADSSVNSSLTIKRS